LLFKHRNGALVAGGGDRNPIDSGLLMPKLNRFSDYDYDNDNDNDCVRSFAYG
jgi:hypothetical protein